MEEQIGIRSRIAVALVRWRSRYIDASYLAYVHGSPRRQRFWNQLGKQVERIAFPIAHWLDRDSMAQEMIEQSWWG